MREGTDNHDFTDVTLDKAEAVSALFEDFSPHTPAWIKRALTLYADHTLADDQMDLRGQFAEYRQFLRHLEKRRDAGELPQKLVDDMGIAFARACAEAESEPVMAVEEIYLKYYYESEAPRARRQAGVSAAASPSL